MSYRSSASRISRELLLDQTYAHLDRDPDPALAALREKATQLVPGDGSLHPLAVFIGEAPGFREDKEGSPFVGPSGRFLDSLLGLAGLRRENVWITNVVKYRPPRNRTPDEDEIEASLGSLRRELSLVAGDHTRLIVGLGRVACSALAGTAISVGGKHGLVQELKGDYRLFVSYHPSAGLRSQRVERQMRDDFQHILPREIERVRKWRVATGAGST